MKNVGIDHGLPWRMRLIKPRDMRDTHLRIPLSIYRTRPSLSLSFFFSLSPLSFLVIRWNETNRIESLYVDSFFSFSFLNKRTWDWFRWNVWVWVIRENDWAVLFKRSFLLLGAIWNNGRMDWCKKRDKSSNEILNWLTVAKIKI